MKKNEISRVMWANIRKWQYLHHYDNTGLAMVLKESERTLYNYDKDPKKIPLGVIDNFFKYVEGEGIEYRDLTL